MLVDLVLLHAPSVYDFRRKAILHGPVSDLIPPSPVFEMYPIGLTSIAEYLERAGYRVRIVNLAARMISNPGFDAAAMIKRLPAPVFGIDLHWMVHCQGAVEVAKMVKACHPEAKVV
ncbi:cobalamin-dependent protein, partial [Chloroflexota bacterium]